MNRMLRVLEKVSLSARLYTTEMPRKATVLPATRYQAVSIFSVTNDLNMT
jgi:hypothetical protein